MTRTERDAARDKKHAIICSEGSCRPHPFNRLYRDVIRQIIATRSENGGASATRMATK